MSNEKTLKRFARFVTFRNKFCLWLSLIVLVTYYGFISVLGFWPELLAYKIEQTSITLGILFGIFLIMLCIALTGIYTLFANKYFDKEQEECIDELKEKGLLEDLQSGEISYV